MLEARVAKLESDVSDIKVSLATLAVRSENFATKSDLIGMHTSLKSGLADTRSSLTSDISNLQRSVAVIESNYASKSDLLDVQKTILDKLEDKRRWSWSGVVIPLAAIVVAAIMAALAVIFK